MSKQKKLTLQLILAVIIIVFGLALLALGFYAPPIGEIHSSVLVSYGEVSTFAGALIGLDYRYKHKEHISTRPRDDKDQADENE